MRIFNSGVFRRKRRRRESVNVMMMMMMKMTRYLFTVVPLWSAKCKVFFCRKWSKQSLLFFWRSDSLICFFSRKRPKTLSEEEDRSIAQVRLDARRKSAYFFYNWRLLKTATSSGGDDSLPTIQLEEGTETERVISPSLLLFLA